MLINKNSPIWLDFLNRQNLSPLQMFCYILALNNYWLSCFFWVGLSYVYQEDWSLANILQYLHLKLFQYMTVPSFIYGALSLNQCFIGDESSKFADYGACKLPRLRIIQEPRQTTWFSTPCSVCLPIDTKFINLYVNKHLNLRLPRQNFVLTQLCITI